jgi:hypothetical protein
MKVKQARTDGAPGERAGAHTCHRMIGPPFKIWYGMSCFETALTA